MNQCSFYLKSFIPPCWRCMNKTKLSFMMWKPLKKKVHPFMKWMGSLYGFIKNLISSILDVGLSFTMLYWTSISWYSILKRKMGMMSAYLGNTVLSPSTPTHIQIPNYAKGIPGGQLSQLQPLLMQTMFCSHYSWHFSIIIGAKQLDKVIEALDLSIITLLSMQVVMRVKQSNDRTIEGCDHRPTRRLMAWMGI